MFKKNYLLSIFVFALCIVSCEQDVIEKKANLSLTGKISASSDSGEQMNADKAIDNDLNTWWQASETETPQVLTVDLGTSYSLNKIQQIFVQSSVWKFVIEGSCDEKNWLMLIDKTKGASGSIFAESVSGSYRYIRLTVFGSSENYPASSKEFLVSGSNKNYNLAIGKHCFTTLSNKRFKPEKATDNNLSTYWVADNGSFPQSLTVDLEYPRSISGVEQIFKDHDSWKFKIEGSSDLLKWDMLCDKSAGEEGFDFSYPASGKYRYVKLTVLDSRSGFWAHSCEFKIYGADPEYNRNMAMNTVASVSSFYTNEYNQYNALDGDKSTLWLAANTTFPQDFVVDLGNPCLIEKVEQIFPQIDQWSFVIEGSNDNCNWEKVADATSGFSGDQFSAKVNRTFRYLRLNILKAANGSTAGSREFRVFGKGSSKTAQWWEEDSGETRYYVKVYRHTLPSIIDSLDIIQAQGYKIMELATPYEGNPEVWGGLGATNNYAIDTIVGTMSDFEKLIEESHKRDIKVVFFGNVGYCWHEAPFFQKACDDERNNVDGKERKWFHFSKTKHNDKWFWSDRAQTYYYSFWGNSDGAEGRIPNYNFNNQEWRDECRNYLNFWADKGIDGLFLDAPGAYDGITDAIISEYIVNVLKRRNLLTNAEGSGDVMKWIGDFGFTCIQGFDLYGWGGGKRSEVLAALRAQNPSGLNDRLKAYRDVACALNGVTVTPPMWEIPASNEERIFEAACLATFGTNLINHYGDHHKEYIAQFILNNWPKEDQEKFYDLIRMQNSYAGLDPVGQRTCIPTNDDQKFLAFKRSNKDGNVAALVIFNFQNREEVIAVKLKNTGIRLQQKPLNLLSGTAAEPITQEQYSVKVPAYGYLILGVENAL